MIWVEILSRHREVAARLRVAGEEACIGRGYDNDGVVDDPYVAARHVRVFRHEAGRLVAEDAGSKNGMFLDRGSAERRASSLTRSAPFTGRGRWRCSVAERPPGRAQARNAPGCLLLLLSL
jgi:hypothetical protein